MCFVKSPLVYLVGNVFLKKLLYVKWKMCSGKTPKLSGKCVPNIWKIAHVTPVHKKDLKIYVIIIVLFRL